MNGPVDYSPKTLRPTPSLTPATDDGVTVRFLPYGGINYYADDITTLQYGDSFATVEEALAEWTRRRNDITGTWQGWGDGQDDYASDQSGIVWEVAFVPSDDYRPAWDTRPVAIEMLNSFNLWDAEPFIGEIAHYYETEA